MKVGVISRFGGFVDKNKLRSIVTAVIVFLIIACIGIVTFYVFGIVGFCVLFLMFVASVIYFLYLDEFFD